LSAAVYSIHQSPSKLIQSAAPVREVGSRVSHISYDGDKILVFGERQLPLGSNPTKYVEWGYLDNSLRLCSADSGKVQSVYESLHLGRITAAVMATEDRLITGGNDSVVGVWKIFKQQRRYLRHLKDLSGHLAPITSLAVSSEYSFVVSGSEDRTCVIWDLNQLRYLRTLRNHEGPVSVICINNANGDIATCSETTLRVWTINGDLLAKNSLVASASPILSCAFFESFGTESELVLTSHENGQIRIWEMLHFNNLDKEHLAIDYSRVRTKRSIAPVSANTVANRSTPSLGSNSFNGSPSNPTADEAEAQTENENWLLKLLHQLDYNGTRDIPGRDHPSRKKSVPLTRLLVVPEQKRIYVGDANGFVYAYSFPDSDDKHWIKDSAVDMCMKCQVKFTVRERKHHCRSCGGIFCNLCTEVQGKSDIRLCQICLPILRKKSN